MDLLLWRHAEAAGQHSNSQEDLQRQLTPHGELQAKRMAAWLEPRLPEGIRILCSPALRCENTVAYLGRSYELCDDLLPSSSLDDMLRLISGPGREKPKLLVAHQPNLGNLVARLLGMKSHEQSIRKGGVWWIRSRKREGQLQTVVHCVMGPELI